MSDHRRLSILGVNVDPLTIDDAITKIIDRSQQKGSVFVVKPYVEFFREDYSKLLNQAWLSLPDGVALQWAAHYQQGPGTLRRLFTTLVSIVLRPERIRHPVPDKFAGTNFTWPLLESAAAHDRSVYLVGSPYHKNIDHTKKTIEAGIADIDIVGTMPGRDESGGFSPNLEQKLLDDLQEKEPDIVLVGIGFPRQEMLMQRLAPKIKKGVLIGEGGTFDYRLFGGAHKKAPELMQRLGLEWFWRLLLQPSRIKRQLAIPKFIWRMYRFTKAGATQYHKVNLKKHKRVNKKL